MKKIIAGLLALLLVCSLFGCSDTTPTPTTTQTTAPAVTDAYTQAAAALRDAQNLKVDLTTKKEITALGGKFTSVSEQELTLTGIGTDAFAATMNEDLDIGELEDRFTEHFADGVLYVNVYDIGYFQGDMNAADFLARFAPAVLLDEALYADVTSEASGSDVTLTFSNPSGPESWALPQGAKFLSAHGSAQITSNGTLSKTVYTMEYIQGSITVSMEVTAQAEIYSGEALGAPQNPYRYNKIESIDVPRLYDTAILYIYNSEAASSTFNQTIVSQAAGYTQSAQTQLHYTGLDKSHLSKVQQTISSVDNTGAMDNYTLAEEFRNGQYTSSENGGAFTPDSSVDAEAMVAYLQSYCSDNVPALNYVASAKQEDVNGLLYLEMGLNPEWGNLTEKDLNYQLFQKEDFLRGYATDYETTTGTYYMFLDPTTGFPVASGTSYAGTHTIDGQKYVLAQEVTQSYRLSDSSTYTELTGELAPETTPQEQATPLLYRVTGTGGQEMYLMGTIHVGDVKTGYLPDEVYAAFESSDALAVEADIMAFEEQVQTDPQLAAKVATIFANATGKPLQEQLGSELYDASVKLMKASGSYNASMELMNPFVWTSSIEDFYLTLGGLRPEKGMDMRLLKLAKAQDKKILEVESATAQYEMLAGFSADLQKLLLEETVTYSVAEYCDEVQSLYDLWCSGDESALREALEEDTGILSNAEQSLYQEYLDAMIIKRNDDMLDVAVSYLESDDTVFYAVGLAHLLQENGLVDTLREKGYTVEQVIYN